MTPSEPGPPPSLAPGSHPTETCSQAERNTAQRECQTQAHQRRDRRESCLKKGVQVGSSCWGHTEEPGRGGSGRGRLLAPLSGGRLARNCLVMGGREAKQLQDFSKTVGEKGEVRGEQGGVCWLLEGSWQRWDGELLAIVPGPEGQAAEKEGTMSHTHTLPAH